VRCIVTEKCFQSLPSKRARRLVFKGGAPVKAGLEAAQKRYAGAPRWHLDEMVCSMNGRRGYLWRAVDDEGEFLDMVMQRERNTGAALKLLKRLLRNQAVAPESIVTDGLSSHKAALAELGLQHIHHPVRLRENNLAENSHLPIRRQERKMQGVKSRASAQRFLTTYTAVYNNVTIQPHLNKRPHMRALRAKAALGWKAACA
jgi:transposase-like protein